ncbi:hypothetical protein [Chryseolinea soli]|uniref:Uncharacterized protein n=1 Tax=Chryseolinea soli TaxID=2321403 RepID=A0A385SV59_9BACT|nr:hypothetical protein [Chryseolinea soli]AYB34191.1 hypothetical protein D4L85_28020 [Chryseolinea soli]
MRNKIIFGIIIIATLLLYVRIEMLVAQYTSLSTTIRDNIDIGRELINKVPKDENPELVMRLEDLARGGEISISVAGGYLGEFYYFFITLCACVLILIVMTVLFFRFRKPTEVRKS